MPKKNVVLRSKEDIKKCKKPHKKKRKSNKMSNNKGFEFSERESLICAYKNGPFCSKGYYFVKNQNKDCKYSCDYFVPLNKSFKENDSLVNRKKVDELMHKYGSCEYAMNCSSKDGKCADLNYCVSCDIREIYKSEGRLIAPQGFFDGFYQPSECPYQRFCERDPNEKCKSMEYPVCGLFRNRRFIEYHNCPIKMKCNKDCTILNYTKCKRYISAGYPSCPYYYTCNSTTGIKCKKNNHVKCSKYINYTCSSDQKNAVDDVSHSNTGYDEKHNAHLIQANTFDHDSDISKYKKSLSVYENSKLANNDLQNNLETKNQNHEKIVEAITCQYYDDCEIRGNTFCKKNMQKGCLEYNRREQYGTISSTSINVSNLSQILPEISDRIPLYMYRNYIFCERKKQHKIEHVFSNILLHDGNTTNKNVAFCRCCNRYYINEEIICDLARRGQFIKYKLHQDYSCNDTSINGWQEESILKMYGYTVSATNNLSSQRRQSILFYLMDNEIISYSKIIDHLSFCIEIREGRKDKDFSNAIKKMGRRSSSSHIA